MTGENQPKYRCFLALPYKKEFSAVREAIVKGAKEADFQVTSLDQSPVSPGSTIMEAIIGEISRSDCTIVYITDDNPSSPYEVGLAAGMGKAVLLIARKNYLKDIPSEIQGFRTILYTSDSEGLSSLSKEIGLSLSEYHRLPRLTKTQPTKFIIDWEKLNEREIENLCRELLTQMGFQGIEWSKISPWTDMIAELPRKDPDGYEYREWWMVSLEIHEPSQALILLSKRGIDFFVQEILGFSDKYIKRYDKEKKFDFSITFLFIIFPGQEESIDLVEINRHMEYYRHRSKEFGRSLRIRFWDQEALTSLIHQYPQIGYKYFSDEGRIQSKTRKSYEELYKENSQLVARQAKLIAELENEKNIRIRAQRDAVWKDISFSAAHKIGNPIFAIETDLEPLIKRIKEQRTGEAVEVIDNIRSSVEKAKAYVEQFKSLARAQEIKPVSIPLRPILQDACRAIRSKDISCQVECPPELDVLADPDRLAECFDELVTNAVRWLDKPGKKIELSTVLPIPEPLPGFLDSSKYYILVHVKDNGCGIKIPDKQEIFDAFFTTNDQGTGLGLALVRRIIDGHGGGIIETGIPGKGADFEVYLPLSHQEKKKSIKKPSEKTRKSKKRRN